MSTAAGVLVYVSFGRGRHVAEVTASMLSALGYASVRGGGVRLVVVTDSAGPFAHLPVEAIVIPAEQAAEWRGPHDYVFNVKMRAMGHVLRTLGAAAAMVDGDTYYRRDPAVLFRRIGPGRTLMHLRESGLGEIPYPAQLALRDALEGHTYVTRRGDTLPLGTGISIWNSGVVGCHPADVELVDEAEAFAGHMHAISGGPIVEQIAFGMLFERYTTLRSAADVVFHYWSPPLRRPLNEKWPKLLEEIKGRPLEEQIAAVDREFPRYTTAFRAKRWFRNRVLVPLGLRERVFPIS